MRWAKSYSIVDHQLLHERHLHRLSTEALALYLFFVVVGDREGKSFYSERRIMEILRLTPAAFSKAHTALIDGGLIEYRDPNVWVKNLETANDKRRTAKENPVPLRSKEVKLPSDRARDWHSTKEVFKTLLRQLD